MKMAYVLILLSLFPSFSWASNEKLIAEAEGLLAATAQICSGISDEISRVSNVSKANTAVTAVGTVAAGGALVAGIKKSQEEEEIDRLVEEICKAGGCTAEGVESMSVEEFFNDVVQPMAEIAELQEHLKNSKTYGDWRTGLMAGTIGTNVASAIISGINKDQSELVQHVQACNQAVVSSANMYERLQKAGVNPAKNTVASKLGDVKVLCGNINVLDIEKVEKRMTGVMGTSVAGAVIGVAGTATSAVANSDKYTDEQKRLDLTEQERKRKDNLNATANIMAGANIATGLVETGLSTSLIFLTKKLMQQAKNCEGIFE